MSYFDAPPPDVTSSVGWIVFGVILLVALVAAIGVFAFMKFKPKTAAGRIS